MKINSISIFALYVIAMITMVFPSEIYAYLDPGSGSYILQILMGTLLGASYLVKVYWDKIKSFFSGKRANETPDSGDEDN